ncbi:MAG: DUF222 domain-containing protein [Deltaproteobacteria bacterium]|nr:DUF222 domain-containing protein [Deltaproteobacteria bacterium]
MTRERLDVLANQIAELSLKIDIAKHSLLTHLRTFDAHDGWAGQGFVSTAAWLAWRIDIGSVAAREHVRVARALGALPLLDAAFAAGQLSYSKVRAITRVATAETEQSFIDVAMYATASQIDKLVAAYKRVRVEPGQQPTDQRRFVRRSETSGGMVRIEIQLPPEQTNILWEAMSAALDAGRREAKRASAEAGEGGEPHASAESRSDAVDPVVLRAERADAMVSVAQAYLQHEPRTLGSGYELVIMTTKDQLERGPGGVGGFLRDGTPVPLHIARMLACDCARVDVAIGESGELLDVGRARERFRPRSAARYGCATVAVGSRAADVGITSRATASKLGPRAARPRCPTWSCSARATIRWCTRARCMSRCAMAGLNSETRTGSRSDRRPRAAMISRRSISGCGPPSLDSIAPARPDPGGTARAWTSTRP